MKYSLKKGLAKGIMSMLTIVLSMSIFAGIAEIDVWSVLEQHLRPLLTGITVGGAITMAINAVKVWSQG